MPKIHHPSLTVAIVIAMPLLCAVAMAEQTPEDIAQRRMAEFEINWGENAERIATIVFQLEKHSGRRFLILPGETGNWGQSTPAGAIVLDEEVLQLSDSVLAGLLAHEWAHHSLGHFRRLRMSFDSHGANPQILQFEREADAYAVRFMAEWDYEIESLTRFLELSPPEQGMHLSHAQHDEGVVRAETMRRLYTQVADETDQPVQIAQIGTDRQAPETATCTRCNGVGWRSTNQTCHSCGGAGVHLCQQCSGWGLVCSWVGWVICPTCQGEGAVQCTRCGTSGSLRITQPCDQCTSTISTPQGLLKHWN